MYVITCIREEDGCSGLSNINTLMVIFTKGCSFVHIIHFLYACLYRQSLRFLTFPYLLTIHLLRFDFDYNTFRRIKLNHRLRFVACIHCQAVLCSNSLIVKHRLLLS